MLMIRYWCHVDEHMKSYWSAVHESCLQRWPDGGADHTVVYFSHVNRRTQYDNPVSTAKKGNNKMVISESIYSGIKWHENQLFLTAFELHYNSKPCAETTGGVLNNIFHHYHNYFLKCRIWMMFFKWKKVDCIL